MEEFKGTKGDWKKTLIEYEGYNILAIKNDKEMIAQLTFGGKATHERESNANLIAAAPDMLEALLKIKTTSEVVGRKNCYYGDTEHDSLSASYGYNECLNDIKNNIEKIINKALGL
jgi:hypothetical protein